jgi:hypothetical protein
VAPTVAAVKDPDVRSQFSDESLGVEDVAAECATTSQA